MVKGASVNGNLIHAEDLGRGRSEEEQLKEIEAGQRESA